MRLTIGDKSLFHADLFSPRDERSLSSGHVYGVGCLWVNCVVFVVYLVDEVPDLEPRVVSSVLPSLCTVSIRISPVTSGAKSFPDGGHGADRAWRVVFLCIRAGVDSRDGLLSSIGEAA